MINPENFKVSCSSIGKIMTEPQGKSVSEKIADLDAKIKDQTAKHAALNDKLKSKAQTWDRIEKYKQDREKMLPLLNSPLLSETCKTYCEDWVRSKVYGRKKEFTAKQTDKGNKTEADAVELLEQFYGWGFAAKNAVRKENNFMSGECDIVLPELIVDIKSSFSCYTFPLFETEIPESDYEWQIRGYMALWGKQKGQVSFVLMDMPDDMIQRELRWKLPEGYTKEDYDKEYAKFIYSNIDVKYRVKSFEFTHDDSKIEQIEKRVDECRAYISEIIKYI